MAEYAHERVETALASITSAATDSEIAHLLADYFTWDRGWFKSGGLVPSDVIVPAQFSPYQETLVAPIKSIESTPVMTPPDAVEALELLLAMVRDGRVRIERFNITQSSADFRSTTIDGRVVSIVNEPASTDFEIGVVGGVNGYEPEQPRATVFTVNGYGPERVAGPLREANPWDGESWNIAAQVAYTKKYGIEKSQEAARAAGVVLGATKPVEPYLLIVGGYSDKEGIRVPVNPTYTFHQRLVEKLSGRRVDHFEMSYRAYELIRDLGFLSNESPVTMRGFECRIGERPISDDAALDAAVVQAKERSGALANKCAMCSQDTRYLAPGDCKKRDCPNKLKTQPPVVPQQRRELIFDD